jgi:hypothetical protein
MMGLHRATAALRRGTRLRVRITRLLLRRCQEALIRQDFGYRFAIAMQETCALKRHAAVERLMSEQESALRQICERAMAEEKSERIQSHPAARQRRGGWNRGRRVRLRWQWRRAANQVAASESGSKKYAPRRRSRRIVHAPRPWTPRPA